MKIVPARKGLLIVLLILLACALGFAGFKARQNAQLSDATDITAPIPKHPRPAAPTTTTSPADPDSPTVSPDDLSRFRFVDTQDKPIQGVAISFLPDPQPPFQLARLGHPAGTGISITPTPTRKLLIRYNQFQAIVAEPALAASTLAAPIVLPISLTPDPSSPSFTGRIIDHTGAPVPGALIWIQSPDDSLSTQSPHMWILSGPTGDFALSWRGLGRAFPKDKTFNLAIAPSEKIGYFPLQFTAKPGVPVTVTLKPPVARTLSIIDTTYGKPFLTNDPSRPFSLQRKDLDNPSAPPQILPFPGPGPVILPDGIYTIKPPSRWVAQDVRITSDDKQSQIVFKLTLPPQHIGRTPPPTTGPFPTELQILGKGHMPLPGFPFSYQDANGNWVSSGYTDAAGIARFPLDKYRTVTVGITLDQTPQQNPLLTQQVQISNGNSPAPRQVVLNYDASAELMRALLLKTPSVPVVDSLGKPMPPGTLVSFPTPDKPTVFTVTADSSLPGPLISPAYRHNFTVSHPDYGSAFIPKLRELKNTVTLKLPLVSNADAQDPMVYTGKCIDQSGSPVPNVKITAFPTKSASASSGLLAKSALALTSTDGSFRYRPLYSQELAKSIQERADNHEPFTLIAVPTDLWFLPVSTSVTLGQSASISLAKADREVSLSFTDFSGDPVPPDQLTVTRIDDLGKPIVTLPGWFPPSGKLPLAYGTYIIKSADGTSQYIFPFKPDSPAKVALAPDSPVTLFTRVIDNTTQNTIPDTLVLATDEFLDYVDVGLFTPETWQKIAALKNPVSIADLPQQLRTLVKPKAAALTNDLGQLRLTPGPMFKPGRTIRLVVIKQGIFPVQAAMRCPDDFPTGVYELHPIPVIASATLDLTFQTIPDDLPPQYEGNPELLLYSDFPFEISRVEYPVAPLNIYATLPLAFPLTETKRSLVIPAGVDVKLMAIRAAIGRTRSAGDYASFHLPTNSVNLKPGQTLPVTLTRKTVFAQQFQPIGPDGKSVPRSHFWIQALQNTSKFRNINTFSYNDNIFEVHVIPGQPIKLGLYNIKTNWFHAYFDFPALQQPDPKPIQIQLNQDQMDMIANQYDKPPK